MCAKIVQVEDNKKEKTKFFHFLLLRRRLSYVKIVQVEDNKKEKQSFFIFLCPQRVCQNRHILFFYRKAPTFSSQGFVMS